MSAPTPASYWVEPGVLLAGAYPSAADVEALVRAGVRAFVDLTEDGELEPYAARLPAGVSHDRLPIADFSSTTPERMRATLDLIDAEVARGRLVYVHCRGGCGRTGTVAGCWLVRRGMEPHAALRRIEDAAGSPCPETDEQRAMIVGWRPGE